MDRFPNIRGRAPRVRCLRHTPAEHSPRPIGAPDPTIAPWIMATFLAACTIGETETATRLTSEPAPPSLCPDECQPPASPGTVALFLDVMSGQVALDDYCAANDCGSTNPEPLLACGGDQAWCFCIGDGSCDTMRGLCIESGGTPTMASGTHCTGADQRPALGPFLR